MNALPAQQLACSVCGSLCNRVGNVQVTTQVPGTQSSSYYRVDSEHGLVSTVLNDPTQVVPGKVVCIDMHGDCGHNFALVLHDSGTRTLFRQICTHLPPAQGAPDAPPPPPLYLTPALWFAFLQEVKSEDLASYAALTGVCPLLDRPRHLVLCCAHRLDEVKNHLQKREVRERLISIMEELAGEGWDIEVMGSHVLDGITEKT